jgi:hypothetical protein
MELGETIATYDVDLALRGESGKFEITSPTSETYFVTCKPNHSSLKPELAGSRTYPQAFFVRKIAESISLEEQCRATSSAVEEPTPASSSRAPFLLENREEQGKLPAAADLLAATQEAPGEAPEVWNLDLFYSESNAGMEPPSASIYVKSAHQDNSGDKPRESLTSPCGSFNELEAEIRKLHAQLDEICSRAKKKFYKAHAAAASA